MTPIPLEIVERVLTIYNEHFREPRFLGALSVSPWYSLFPDEPERIVTKYKWGERMPNGNSPGIYMMFDAYESLLYVGKTTGTIHGRARYSYFRNVSKQDNRCRINEDMLPMWTARPCYVCTIAVEDIEEVHCLEKFLIMKLSPPDNKETKLRLARIS